MKISQLSFTVFALLIVISITASQSYRNGTVCKIGPYKRQIVYNETSESTLSSTAVGLKLNSIEAQGKMNSAKMEVVLQVMAETQRSLLFIERKLREHHESNGIIALQLKEKILALEQQIKNMESSRTKTTAPPEDVPEIDSTTQGTVVFDDPPFIRRNYSSARLLSATVHQHIEDVPEAQNETETSDESAEAEATSTSTAKPTKAPKAKKLRRITSTSRPDVAATQLNSVSLGTLDLLMRHPRARLFTEEDLNGEYMDYHSDYSAERGCQNLDKFAGRVKSVDPYSTCVRVFLDDNCQGWSQAIYDGGSQPKTRALNSKLNVIRSIGRCVPGEFINAESVRVEVNPGVFKDVVSKAAAQHHKLFYIPDLIEFRSDGKSHNSIRVRDNSHLVTNYLRGYGGRLEFSESMITKANLRSEEDLAALLGNSSDSSSSESSSESREQKDGLGLALPVNLGGSLDEKYNLFPQSERSKNEWNDKLKWVPAFLEKYPGSWVSISLNIVYESETSTRPIALAYYIDKFNRQIMYGYIQD